MKGRTNAYIASGGGGTTISVSVYSAANDTIYYIENGVQRTLCQTDAYGKALNVPINIGTSGKTYELISTIAKDPTNLSNPYSKVVSVNGATTDIILMPNNAAYWYGYVNTTLTGGIEGELLGRSNQTPATFNCVATKDTNKLVLEDNNTTEAYGIAFVSHNLIDVTSYSAVKAIAVTTGGGGLGLLDSTNLHRTDNRWNWHGTPATIGTTKSVVTKDLTAETGNYGIAIGRPDAEKSIECEAIWFE